MSAADPGREDRARLLADLSDRVREASRRQSGVGHELAQKCNRLARLVDELNDDHALMPMLAELTALAQYTEGRLLEFSGRCAGLAEVADVERIDEAIAAHRARG